MRRELRLRSSRRFSQIHQEGRSWANSYLVLKVLSNGADKTLFGLVTTRRLGGAVVRNKIRRRLREILRDAPVKVGWDLVFIARKRKEVPRFNDLKGAAHNLLHRAKLLEITNLPRKSEN